MMNMTASKMEVLITVSQTFFPLKMDAASKKLVEENPYLLPYNVLQDYLKRKEMTLLALLVLTMVQNAVPLLSHPKLVRTKMWNVPGDTITKILKLNVKIV
jgi:hypothetical protein